MNINITQAHVDLGQRMHSRKCAVALALNAAGLAHNGVCTGWISYAGGRSGPLSARLRTFIERFDADQPVILGTYRVPTPLKETA